MGRSKITIRRLESAAARQNTYSKRKNGITNKAKELSILCDVDVLLLMFSPGGKPILITGAHSNFEAFVEKFSGIPRHERAKRRRETLEELKSKLSLLQAATLDANYRLGCWANIEKVNDMVRLCEMEESAVKSLDRLQKIKEFLARREEKNFPPKEEVFTQALHFGLAGGSSSTGHIFPVARRDVGCSMHPIQPSEKVGSGLDFNPEYPCHHRGHNLIGSGNSMHGPYRNIGVPSCPIQHHEPMKQQLKTASHFSV
ncbi:hypothetical protein AAC387_Pa02g4701 [Persea americana]